MIVIITQLGLLNGVYGRYSLGDRLLLALTQQAVSFNKTTGQMRNKSILFDWQKKREFI
jgi:hypothetical protein